MLLNSRKDVFIVVMALFVLLALLVTPVALHAGGPNAVARSRIIAAQQRHTERLMAIKGVVGTAAGSDAVIVLTMRPDVAKKLPKDLDGVPVTVKVSGKIRALVVRTGRFDRPVPIGVSTGNKGECSAGTIGCRVTDGTKVYALSNNHVFALENAAPLGSKILQPGLFDTNCSFDENNVIGTLHDFEPLGFSPKIKNKMDAAIALCSPQTLGEATPSDGYGAPDPTVVAAELNQQVMKYGRTTGQTLGQVTGVNAMIRVSYGSRKARFVNQIIVESAGAFILPGDSGSLLVTGSGKNPVGLLFAGNQTGTFAVASPIQPILDRFGVVIGGSVAPVTDIAITAISAPTQVTKGSAVTVSVTTKNIGNQAVTDDIVVTLRDQTDGVDIGSQTITGGLALGASAVVNFSWNTSAASLGDHTLEASQNIADDVSANDTMTTTVRVEDQAAQISVTLIDPNTMVMGTTVSVTITGSDFASGATVSFLNGLSIAPVATNVNVVNATTITATVTVKKGGPKRERLWDVQVTNPDGSTGILAASFTVTP